MMMVNFDFVNFQGRTCRQGVVEGFVIKT